jgi:hypothetical protein
MSCNRENVTWKSRDGTWNRGFYDFYQTGEDYEWDVEYDNDRFNWVSLGHATEEEANLSWDGANPGGGEVYHEPSAETDRFDAMAQVRKKEMDEIKRSIATRRQEWRQPWR